MRITFKREERLTGLARIGQGMRGYRINMDGRDVGSINYCPTKHSHIASSEDPVYVVLSSPLPYFNGFSEGKFYPELAEAKKFSKDYIKKHMEAK